MKIMIVPSWFPIQEETVRALSKAELKLKPFDFIRPTVDNINGVLNDFAVIKGCCTVNGIGCINYTRHDFLVFEDAVEAAEFDLEDQNDKRQQVVNTWVAPGLIKDMDNFSISATVDPSRCTKWED